jgi:triosephosphate isomerase (TIM)
MRKNIVAGNWKMNKDFAQAQTLVSEIKAGYSQKNVEVILATPFPFLQKAVEQTAGTGIKIAAQNMHQAEGGAFTGEVSASMLTSIGVQTIILGHSERRAYFNETDALLANKVDTALKHNMQVIFCFGEELKDRQNNNHFNVVEYQLRDGLFHISKENWNNIILAYEPVWAIGTGETATAEQAQEMHLFIRNLIDEVFGSDVAQNISILYGGSVKPDNAKEIFSKPDVDGGLIGGAALNATDFFGIINGVS